MSQCLCLAKSSMLKSMSLGDRLSRQAGRDARINVKGYDHEDTIFASLLLGGGVPIPYERFSFDVSLAK